MWNAFLDAMRELNYEEGRNLVVRRGATGDGRPDHLPEFVAGFLRDGVDVIVTTSTQETRAAQQGHWRSCSLHVPSHNANESSAGRV